MELKIKEIFHSIQGEGPFVGRAAIFIRLSGCNLKCHFCDEHHDIGTMMTVEEIMKKVESFHIAFPHIRLVVITGGEPFTQKFGPLVNALRHDEYIVQIETNGTIFQEDFPYEQTVVVCSPKVNSEIDKRLMPHIKAVKYLIMDGQDISEVPRPDLIWYLQPIDTGEPISSRRNMQWAAQICISRGYILSLQTHKIVGLK